MPHGGPRVAAVCLSRRPTRHGRPDGRTDGGLSQQAGLPNDRPHVTCKSPMKESRQQPHVAGSGESCGRGRWKEIPPALLISRRGISCQSCRFRDSLAFFYLPFWQAKVFLFFLFSEYCKRVSGAPSTRSAEERVRVIPTTDDAAQSPHQLSARDLCTCRR